MSLLRAWLIYLFLLSIKLGSRVFFRHKVRWIGKPLRSYRRVKVIAGLNHTSLYEWLYAGSLPPALLWRIARHGVIPIADKTGNRPLTGRFFKLLGQNVIKISRKADDTWEQVLSRISPDSCVVIFPEGRMKRRSGFDADGNPLVVRGGIADIIRLLPEGHLLLAYSGGLHHIQVPGQLLPVAGQPDQQVVVGRHLRTAAGQFGLLPGPRGDGQHQPAIQQAGPVPARS